VSVGVFRLPRIAPLPPNRGNPAQIFANRIFHVHFPSQVGINLSRFGFVFSKPGDPHPNWVRSAKSAQRVKARNIASPGGFVFASPSASINVLGSLRKTPPLQIPFRKKRLLFAS
jgi:hypothetical protein